MKRTGVNFCLVFGMILALSAGAAVAQIADPGARKFDEFGDIQASDLIARLDNLAIQLQSEPNNKAYLVVYRTRRDLPGLSNRYAQRMKGYLTRSRGIAPERVITVDGGVASCLTQELWVVPPSAAPPPRSDAYSNSYNPAVYKFDEHSYANQDPEGLYYWQDSPEELLEAFGFELQKNPKSIGYLIAYRSRERNNARVAENALRRERDYLIKQFGISPGRLRTIQGGVREMRTIELWVSQERGAVPIITSYRYSAR